jgi:hypothetical protein
MPFLLLLAVGRQFSIPELYYLVACALLIVAILYLEVARGEVVRAGAPNPLDSPTWDHARSLLSLTAWYSIVLGLITLVLNLPLFGRFDLGGLFIAAASIEIGRGLRQRDNHYRRAGVTLYAVLLAFGALAAGWILYAWTTGIPIPWRLGPWEAPFTLVAALAACGLLILLFGLPLLALLHPAIRAVCTRDSFADRHDEQPEAAEPPEPSGPPPAAGLRLRIAFICLLVLAVVSAAALALFPVIAPPTFPDAPSISHSSGDAYVRYAAEANVLLVVARGRVIFSVVSRSPRRPAARLEVDAPDGPLQVALPRTRDALLLGRPDASHHRFDLRPRDAEPLYEMMQASRAPDPLARLHDAAASLGLARITAFLDRHAEEGHREAGAR